jgi:hypothetical protein
MILVTPSTVVAAGRHPLGGAGGDEWSQSRFDASHAGFNPSETQITKGTVGSLRFLWGYVGNFVATPIEIAGLVDISYEGRVAAVDPSTGSAVWQRSFNEGLAAGVAGMGTSIYVPTPERTRVLVRGRQALSPRRVRALGRRARRPTRS